MFLHAVETCEMRDRRCRGFSLAAVRRDTLGFRPALCQPDFTRGGIVRTHVASVVAVITPTPFLAQRRVHSGRLTAQSQVGQIAETLSLQEVIVRRTQRAVFVVLVVIVLVLHTPRIAAQQFYGTITGTVTDPSGAVVPNATVKVTNVATNVTIDLKTDGVGVYVANDLVVGTYRVEAQASGFKKSVVDKIGLQVGATPKVDLALAVGQSSEVVNVTAANAALLQTQQADLGQTVDTSMLANLPIEGGGANANGRSPYNLLSLAPGVSQQTGCTNGTGGSSLGACGNEGNVRVSGSRPRTDDNVLDGVAVTSIVFGGPSVQPSVEAIQEFRIEQNSMSAEYGKAGGLIVIQVSKSGTNQFHGSGYEYNRNENWDARDFFADPTLRKNPYNLNDFGGSIGGPIVKGKLFFFSDIERINNHGETVNHGVTVPNALFRSGDLGTLCTGNGYTFSSGVCTNTAFQIYDPVSHNSIPNNNIAACELAGSCTPLSTASANFLALWPSGGTPVGVGTNVMTINPPYHNTDTLVNPRVDLNLSQSDHIFGTFHYDYYNAYYNSTLNGPAGVGIGRGRQYVSTVGWTHTISPTTLNEFRLGVSHHLGDRMPSGVGFTSPALLGIPAIPDCLSSIPDTANGTKCGTPGVSVNGYGGFSNSGMLYEPSTGLHFSDSLSKLMGKHSLKVGFQADHYSIDNYQPNGVTGNFLFNNGQATNSTGAGGGVGGNAFASYLFGRPSKTSSFQGQS